jgi:hypothetical protein
MTPSSHSPPSSHSSSSSSSLLSLLLNIISYISFILEYFNITSRSYSLLSITIVIITHITIVIDLTKKLYYHIRKGSSTWITMLIRLLLFTLILIPGWIKMLIYYIFDSKIIRNIDYGHGAKYRNLLDIWYFPFLS